MSIVAKSLNYKEGKIIEIKYEEEIRTEVMDFLIKYFNLSESEIVLLKKKKISFAIGMDYQNGACSFNRDKVLINLSLYNDLEGLYKEQFYLENAIHELTHWLQNLRGTYVSYNIEPKWAYNPSEKEAVDAAAYFFKDKGWFAETMDELISRCFN